MFLYGQLSDTTKLALADYKGDSDSKSLRSALAQDLNKIVRQDPRKAKAGEFLSVPERFSGISLSEKTQKQMSQKADEDARSSGKESRGGE